MGRAIYVSSVNGDDANSGYAPEKAFRSLRKVNQMEIQPGDQILLERGSVFVGEYLHLYRGGTKEAPVVVDAYGEGALPRIETDGNGIWYQNYWRSSGQCSTYLERLSVLSGSFIRCRIHFHPESGNYKQPMRPK